MTSERQLIAVRLEIEMEEKLEKHGILHRVYCGYAYESKGKGHFHYQLNCYSGNTPPLMRTGGGRYRFKMLDDNTLRDIIELDQRGVEPDVTLRERLELFNRHPEWKLKYKEDFLDCLFTK